MVKRDWLMTNYFSPFEKLSVWDWKLKPILIPAIQYFPVLQDDTLKITIWNAEIFSIHTWTNLICQDRAGGDLRGQVARGSLLLRSRKLCLASKTAMAPNSRTSTRSSKPSMKRQEMEACLLYHICQGSHIPWSRKWRLKTRRWTGRENRHCRKTRSKASVHPNSNVYKSLWLNLKF